VFALTVLFLTNLQYLHFKWWPRWYEGSSWSQIL